MALNTLKCNHLMPLDFRGLRLEWVPWQIKPCLHHCHWQCRLKQ